ncbi:MAG: acetyl-CoA carboxylase carboxyltransferase subunit alpha [Acidobacteria bacterium]|nr:acetyl-CoA carboxylase carboxyltransferase subunit alpha [Acidobacteriota bacterium]
MTDDPSRLPPGSDPDTVDLEDVKKQVHELRKRMGSRLTPWERVRLSRHELRPYTLDYVERLFTHFSEIHGDRRFGDDPAIVAGMALFHGEPVAVVGQQKGRNMKERLLRNYGMAQPEGYRKALRIMKFAEKFQRPVITLIDTPGAYPGIGAEERGQAEAIAYNLREMARLRVPIVCVVLGEGGSGGALGIGVGDRILMLENSVYSVISPESCSAILWKDQEHAEEAARALKLTPDYLYEFGLIDEVLPETGDGAHTDHATAAKTVDEALQRHLAEVSRLDPEERSRLRYEKFRRMGAVAEAAAKESLA